MDDLAAEQFCYLTTTGRRSGRPHEIEIWFGLADGTLYMLSGGGEKSDWVANLVANRNVSLRIGERTFETIARVVSDPNERKLAARLLLEKYEPTYTGDLTAWGDTALPIAIDLPL
ncbi:MAG: nitroreductase family deazaflavin-dependent oxidoreductase [Chloroflexota bacterium]